METGSYQENRVPFPAMDEPEKPQQGSEASDSRTRGKSEGGSSGHRRGLSSNLLSKISLLRSATGSSEKVSGNGGGGADDEDIVRPGVTGAMAAVQQSAKTRKRKGSLRKAALLGKGRDRKGSDAKQRSPLSSPQPSEENEKPAPAQTTPVTEEEPTPRASYENPGPRPVSPVSPPRWPLFSTSRLSLASIRSSVPSVEPASSSAASITSPILPTDASTTDDDESLHFTRIPSVAAPRKPPAPALFRRRSPSRTKSPLATQPTSLTNSPVPSEDVEWDYSETAFWGYVILIITWLVFVVGLGSCFDVWSWAWDVGETPKAPPELEDDPTLPIVGYYPALLVLTCVMAWVWVIVAWVGMKYFRHADLRGDDG